MVSGMPFLAKWLLIIVTDAFGCLCVPEFVDFAVVGEVIDGDQVVAPVACND